MGISARWGMQKEGGFNQNMLLKKKRLSGEERRKAKEDTHVTDRE